MAQGSPRTRFESSGLVRVLRDLTVADVAEAKQSFAERLGQWLDFNDALALFSALNADAAGAAEPRTCAPSPEAAALRQAFARVRGALVDSMAAEGMLKAVEAHIELPTGASKASVESATDFAPYRRYYLARQRDMNTAIGPLRAMVRAALSRHSPALRRLAVLDAVLDQGLAARERESLAKVPALLARRFDQLCRAHQATVAEGQAADDADRSTAPGGWLATFCGEMRAVLLAELDVRLQPIAGLIAALEKR